jgi:predicted transcriptional regulator
LWDPSQGLTLVSRRQEQQGQILLKVNWANSQNLKMSTQQFADKVEISDSSAYCAPKYLVEKGFVKLGNFKKNPRKSSV